MAKKSRATRMTMPRKTRDSQPNPRTDLIVYRGPIRYPDSGVPSDEIVAVMSTTYGVTGGATGAQFTVYTSSITGANDWSSFVALYDEYRVLGMEAKFCPNYGYGNNGVVHSTGLWVTTHQGATVTPFTNLSQMLEYSDWSEFNTGKNSTKQWRMSSTEEAQFSATASPVSGGSVTYFAPFAITTSVTYGVVYFSWRVQFRGRK